MQSKQSIPYGLGIHVNRINRFFLLGAVLFGNLVFGSQASTVVQGSVSGVWSSAGNPYYVVADCTIPAGQTLTIEPGVIINVASNVSIFANGSYIRAIGTPTERIVIQGFPSTNTWGTISAINSIGTNCFRYCDFRDAQTAISMRVNGDHQVMPVEVLNCTFSNCIAQGIYGEAQGPALCGYGCGGNYYSSATLNPTIKNCYFFNTSNGCVLKIFGQSGNCNCTIFGGPYAYGYGSNYAIIAGNIFQNLAGTALEMSVDSYAGGGKPMFVNNTVVHCFNGVVAEDPWDAQVQGNVFVGGTNAVAVTGALTRNIGYNNFYDYATNFSGLPPAYGQQFLSNFGGSPCDVFNNIYQDPLFIAAGDFHLATNSPCINAGANDEAYNNICSPPSIGLVYGDMGAFGGPDACNWLDSVPLVSAHLTSLSFSADYLWLNWLGVPRSTYQIQFAIAPINQGTNQWQNLTNGLVTVSGAWSSFAVGNFPQTNTMTVYRLQSLGRAAGD